MYGHIQFYIFFHHFNKGTYKDLENPLRLSLEVGKSKEKKRKGKNRGNERKKQKMSITSYIFK